MELLQESRTRAEIIEGVGNITEIYVAAWAEACDDAVVNNVADFPMEIIPHTTNGYQRFLSEQIQGDQKGSATAGFIINLRVHLKLEFGKAVLEKLRGELFTSTPVEAPATSRENSLSLWELAYQKYNDASPGPDFDALVTYLFLQRLKWTTVRAQVSAPPPAESKK